MLAEPETKLQLFVEDLPYYKDFAGTSYKFGKAQSENQILVEDIDDNKSDETGTANKGKKKKGKKKGEELLIP